MSKEDCVDGTNHSFSWSNSHYSTVLDIDDIEPFIWPVLVRDRKLLEPFLWPEVISVSLTMTDEKNAPSSRLDPRFRLYNLGRPIHNFHKEPLCTRFGPKQKTLIPERSLNNSGIEAIVLKESVGNIPSTLRDKLKYGSVELSDGEKVKDADFFQTISRRQMAGYWKWETFPFCHVRWEEYSQEKSIERSKFSVASTSNSDKFRPVSTTRKQYHQNNGNILPQWKINFQQNDQTYQIMSTHNITASNTAITQQRNIFSTLCQSSLQNKNVAYSNNNGGQHTSLTPISRNPKDEKKAYQKHTSFSLKYQQQSFHARAITRREQPVLGLSSGNEAHRSPNKTQNSKDCNKQESQGAIHLFEPPYFLRFPPPPRLNGPPPQNWHLPLFPFFHPPLPNEQRNFPLFTPAFPLNPQMQPPPGIYPNNGFPQPMNVMQPFLSVSNGRGSDFRMLQNCQHELPGSSFYAQIPFMNHHIPMPCHNQQQSFFMVQGPPPHGQHFPSFQAPNNQFSETAHQKEREGGNTSWTLITPSKPKYDLEKRNTGTSQDLTSTSKSPIRKKQSGSVPQHSASDSNLAPSNNSKQQPHCWGTQQNMNAPFYPLAQGDFIFNQPWCHAPFQPLPNASQTPNAQTPALTVSSNPHNLAQGNPLRSFKESQNISKEIPKYSPPSCSSAQLKIPVMIRKRKLKKQPRKIFQNQDFRRQIPLTDCKISSTTKSLESIFEGLTDGENSSKKIDNDSEVPKEDDEANLDKAAVELKCLLGIKSDH